MATEYLDLDDAFDAYAEAAEVSVEQAKDALLKNGYDLTLSDDERFELALAVAASHAGLDEVETRLRPAVVPL